MPSIKSILVTGAKGQLGQSIRVIASLYSQYQFTFATRADLDLSQTDNISDYFQLNQFDLVINCAAYTSVDKAEQEPKLANAINHLAVKKLAEIAKLQNSVLIHISTDYVFDGTSYKPYIETDQTNPQNIYGSSKLNGEQAIQAVSPKGCIIRTSWVYSEFGNNFVKTMLKLGQQSDRLAVIFDQVASPTYAKDLAQTIMNMVVVDNRLQNQVTLPVYHYSNEGVCSWYDFAKAIFAMSDIGCAITPIETKDYPTPATRPYYSLLNKAKIKHDYEMTLPYWKDSLQICLQRIKESKTQ